MDELVIKILRLHNFWPKIGKENENPFNIVTIITFILCFWLPIGCILHLGHSIYEDAPLVGNEVTEDVIQIFSFVGMAAILTLYLKNRKRIIDLRARLKDYSSFGEPIQLEMYKKKTYYCNMSYLLTTYISTVIYSLIPILQYQDCIDHNIKYNRTNICGFTSYTWLPYDIDYFPLKQLYGMMSYSMTSVCGISSVSCVILLFDHSQAIVCRVDHLIDMICYINEVDIVTKQREIIKRIVVYHTLIKDFVKETNVCFSKIILVFVLWSPLLFGMIAYQYLMEKKLKHTIYAFTWFTVTIIPSFTGQLLINHSEKIPEAIYNIHWYKLDEQIKSDLYTILINATTPMTFTCAGFGDLSFVLFQKLMKTSYSYVTLLNQVI